MAPKLQAARDITPPSSKSFQMQKRYTPNRPCVLLIFVGFIVFSSPLNVRASDDDLILTDEDRTELLRQVLGQEITRRKEEQRKYGRPRKGDYEIIISTSNIKPELVPKIPDVNFIFLKPDEIEERVTRAGLAYLAFSKFEVQGSKVVVTLDKSFKSRRRPRAFISVQSFTYEYHKVDGRWVGKLTRTGHLIT